MAMVIVMAAACYTSFAEESENDKYMSELKIIDLYYRVAPDEFGADYIMDTYLNLMLYLEAEALDYFYLVYNMTNDKDITAVDYIRDYAIGATNMVKVATDGYLDWLNGKMTDSQYAEVLMAIVNGVIESAK